MSWLCGSPLILSSPHSPSSPSFLFLSLKEAETLRLAIFRQICNPSEDHPQLPIALYTNTGLPLTPPSCSPSVSQLALSTLLGLARLLNGEIHFSYREILCLTSTLPNSQTIKEKMFASILEKREKERSMWIGTGAALVVSCSQQELEGEQDGGVRGRPVLV